VDAGSGLLNFRMVDNRSSGTSSGSIASPEPSVRIARNRIQVPLRKCPRQEVSELINSGVASLLAACVFVDPVCLTSLATIVGESRFGLGGVITGFSDAFSKNSYDE
jgi:hypothetical protein